MRRAATVRTRSSAAPWSDQKRPKLVKKLLRLNRPDKQYVEVILLSRNSADTGLRVFNAIKHYGLDISRAAFTSGAAYAVFAEKTRGVVVMQQLHVAVGKLKRRNGLDRADVIPALGASGLSKLTVPKVLSGRGAMPSVKERSVS